MHDKARRTTWSIYQAAWADTTAAEQARLLGKSVADGCVYADPDGVWEGRNAITGKIEQYRSDMPGTVFRNHTYLFHHGWSLAHWALYDANGAEMVPGASVAEYGPDGRIVRVTGFFPDPRGSSISTAVAAPAWTPDGHGPARVTVSCSRRNVRFSLQTTPKWPVRFRPTQDEATRA